jgi:hypothetical protein
MMNLERAAMRGKLSEKQDAAQKLRYRIEGNCQGIRAGLNTALTPVDDLEIPMLSGQMDELVMAWGELQGVLAEISRLEKALR